MYKIRGADQKEYGPVSADQVRQWISEQRLDAQSLVRLEGTEEWKQLSQFPEFAGALASASPHVPATLAPITQVGPRTNQMALAGFIMGLCTVVLGCCCYGMPFNILGIVFSAIGLSQINKNPEMEKGRGLAIAGLVISIVATIIIVILVVVGGVVFNFDEIRRHMRR
jgi:uncharacterized protein DUF4190/uncharacterized protein DUF4339